MEQSLDSLPSWQSAAPGLRKLDKAPGVDPHLIIIFRPSAGPCAVHLPPPQVYRHGTTSPVLPWKTRQRNCWVMFHAVDVMLSMSCVEILQKFMAQEKMDRGILEEVHRDLLSPVAPRTVFVVSTEPWRCHTDLVCDLFVRSGRALVICSV